MLALLAMILSLPAAAVDCGDAQGRYYSVARQARLSPADVAWLVAQLDGPCADSPVVDDLLGLHDSDGIGGDPELPLQVLALRTLASSPDGADAMVSLLLDPGRAAWHTQALAVLPWSDHPLDPRLQPVLLDRIRARPLDPDAAMFAAIALCRTPDGPEQDDAMIAALRHLADLPPADATTEGHRAAAIGRLGACLFQRTGRLDAAVRALRSRPALAGVSRVDAAIVLAGVDPDPRLLPVAVDALGGRDVEQRRAVELLGLLGPAGRSTLVALRPTTPYLHTARWVALFQHPADLDPRDPALAELLAWQDLLPEASDRSHAAAQLRKHAETVGHPAAWQPVLAHGLDDPDESVRWWTLRAWVALLPRLPVADRAALLDRLDTMLAGDADARDLARSAVADARNEATSVDDARAWVRARR